LGEDIDMVRLKLAASLAAVAVLIALYPIQRATTQTTKGSAGAPRNCRSLLIMSAALEDARRRGVPSNNLRQFEGRVARERLQHQC
jgi:hypothetical protein